MTDAYSAFADPQFDPHKYVHQVLAGQLQSGLKPSSRGARPTGNQHFLADSLGGTGDISVAISKLSFGVEDVSKQIKNVITHNYEHLLDRASNVSEMDSSVRNVRQGLNELDASVDKLRRKVRIPYQTLSTHVMRLQRLQQASEALRRTSRFILLARRLEYQLSSLPKSSDTVRPMASATGNTDLADSLAPDDEGTERDIILSKAALSVAELEDLLERDVSDLNDNGTEASVHTLGRHQEEAITPPTISLQHIKVVSDHIPSVESARRTITTEMESLVTIALSESNQPRLASSLQTARNLRILPKLVQSLVSDLTDAVQARLRSAFDMSKISKESSAKDSASSPTSILYRSRVRTEPTNITAPQWTAALWTRLENLIGELADCCIKVYTLERVLKVKKDPSSQIPFLDEVMKTLDDKPSTTFWGVLARSLEKQSRDAVKGSTFLQQTLSQGYPRLLRLFHDFFAKISVHTDTIYSESQQSTETILVLRSLSPFEKLYLSRSTNKLNETVAQSLSGGVHSPPSMGEGLAIARTISNELDSARFDPLLVRSVAKTVGSALDTFLARMNNLIVKDRSATTTVGNIITPQLALNLQLATTLFHCWSRLSKLFEEYPENVVSMIAPSVNKLRVAFEEIVNPVIGAIRRDLAAAIARLHRLDFSQSLDEASGMGGGASAYMKELSEKLGFVRSDVLARINTSENREWIIAIAQHVIQTFTLHASIAKPLGESGKLRLTSDMTELEFAINLFIMDNAQSKMGIKLETLGETFKTLRSMRPLLFLSDEMLADNASTAGVPPLLVLHHILVRSPLQLPHRLHGWQEAEYVAWLDEHTAEEALTLVEGDLLHWEKTHVVGDDGEAEGSQYIELARAVLRQAR